GLGKRRQDGPRLRHAGTRSRVGIPQVIPGPEAVEARLLGGDRGGTHVTVAGAHRDQEKVRLHDRALTERMVLRAARPRRGRLPASLLGLLLDGAAFDRAEQLIRPGRLEVPRQAQVIEFDAVRTALATA